MNFSIDESDPVTKMQDEEECSNAIINADSSAKLLVATVVFALRHLSKENKHLYIQQLASIYHDSDNSDELSRMLSMILSMIMRCK